MASVSIAREDRRAGGEAGLRGGVVESGDCRRVPAGTLAAVDGPDLLTPPARTRVPRAVRRAVAAAAAVPVAGLRGVRGGAGPGPGGAGGLGVGGPPSGRDGGDEGGGGRPPRGPRGPPPGRSP